MVAFYPVLVFDEKKFLSGVLGVAVWQAVAGLAVQIERQVPAVGARAAMIGIVVAV